MSIQYNNYSSLSDYQMKNPVYPNNQFLYASKLTLIRGAIVVGLSPKKYLSLPKELTKWKILTMLTFIDTNSNFTIKNVDELETSERVTVAYFIGMVFAQIYMQSKYKVRHMEHLKNPGITTISLPGDLKNPDLWGINRSTGMSYLVEAKGSTVNSNYFKNKNIIKAANQLNAILQIDYTDSGVTSTYNQTNSNLQKLIIATHPNSNNEMMQHIIDPSDEEDKIIKVSADELVYKQYSHLIRIILEEDSIIISLDDFENIKFRVIDLEIFDCYVGVVDEVFSILEPLVIRKKISKDDLIGTNEKVNQCLDDIKGIIEDIGEQEQVSVGIDGVIVLAKSYVLNSCHIVK